jgi:diaminopimelate decarboxylase
MRAHEAGALHAEAGHRGPSWLREPADVNTLEPRLWARNVERGPDGVLSVAGIPVDAIAREFGTPSYVMDEDDFRARARTFAQAFDAAFQPLCGGADVYYAGKAFLSIASVRWIAEEGLNLDVCTGG